MSIEIPSLEKLSAVVFDCDGVIFDSNWLKSEAFRCALSGYPERAVNTFISYHQAPGGVSRYVKFRVFFSDILEKEPVAVDVDRLLARFSETCIQLYQEAQLTPGCKSLLERLAIGHRLYIASGGDETELCQVFADRGLSDLFSSIFGSPKDKVACLAEVVAREEKEKLLFIGDSVADWEAAREWDVPFLFMTRFSEARECVLEHAAAYGVPIIDSLTDMHRVWWHD